MRKFTLTIITALFSWCGYSQLAQEGFEGTFPPPGWGIYDNGIGLGESWEHTNPLNTNFPPYAGTYAAFLNREQVPDEGPAAQDWLITPQFTAPTNPQLRFYSRLSLPGNQGGIYKVLISVNPVQSALTQYTLLQEWTEVEINPSQEDYREIVVNLPEDLTGQPVYIAFVMEADFKDRWLIDNVRVVERCLEPENLEVSNITETTANLSWDSPGTATSWEIEFLPTDVAPTGSGIVYNGTMPYEKTGLILDTNYKFYVRAICADGLYSDWVGPVFFETESPGANCDAPKVITALPYLDPESTEGFGIDFTGPAGTSCGLGPGVDAFGGNDVVYTYTPATDMVVEISATDIGNNFAGVYVYTSCDNIGVECFAADANEDTTANLSTGQINLSAGTTYHIVIATPGWPESTTYTLHVDEVTCPHPFSLQLSGLTTSTANFTWVEFGDATTWEYVLQPAGLGIPTGSGTSIGTTSYNATGLSLNSSYDFFVRSVCGAGEFSEWVGPITFTTLCNPFDVPFTEGFNSDSSTETCWTTISYNGAAAWNTDNAVEPYEGDEAAVLSIEDNTNNNHDWIISPPINLTANQRLRYHYKVSGFWGSGATFKVVMSTTGVDQDDFSTVLLPSQSYTSGDYTEKEIFLDDIPVGTVFFAWVVEEGGSASVSIDNIRIDPIPPCPIPTALSVSTITQTTAELSWTAGFNETAWEVVVQPTEGSIGIPTADGTPATNPYTATGLTSNTEYEYYVRAICGGSNGNSAWIGPFIFRTKCDPFNVPFYEGFNTGSVTEYCWTINDENGGWDKWVLDSEAANSYEGDQSARYNSEFTTSNDDWLITPAINLTANQRLSFQHKLYDYIYPVAMEVRLSTTGTNPEDFTEILLPVEIYTNNFFIKEVVDLSAYTGTVYIAWHAPGGADSGMYWYLDDVRIESLPACADPYNLQATNLTPNSAQLSWTAGNGETQWEVVVQPSGEGVPTAPGVITGNNPYTATGLLSGTPYQFYVRAVCADGTSIWNGPYPFVTIITNDECANSVIVPVNPGVECDTTVAGTVTGATLSPPPGSCDMEPNDDVWFHFTATSTEHNISILNVSGWGAIHFSIYQGTDCTDPDFVTCNNFQNSITLYDLVPGEIYKIRVYTGNVLQTTTFEVCVRTPNPPIAVDNTTYTVEELVTDVLVGSECAQVSNITWSTGSNFVDGDGVPNPNGIAYFDQNGSLFPMEGGIVLTTGDAMKAPGPENGIISDGNTSWPGDAELDAIVLAATGEPMNSINATVLEFDFVPLVSNFSFEFLFASEEYGDFQCVFSDSFAFLLTDEDGNTVNLAVVPGTNQPVSVVTIRDDAYNDQCESVNPEYFDQYVTGIDGAVAETNFQGRTKKLVAQATVMPNSLYHIKMVIADRGGDTADTDWDSAVFLAAGSFNIGNAALGPDLTVADGTAICSNETHTITSGLNPDIFSFKWSKDEVVIPGETGPDLVVSETGVYKLEAEVTGQGCAASDSVLIEFYPAVEDITQSPNDNEVCSDNASEAFNLVQNDFVIIGTQNPADFTITYHASESDAQSGNNALVSPYENISNPQMIYARVVYEPTGCYGIHSFTIRTVPTPDYSVTPDFSLCEGNTGTIAVTPINFDAGDALYSWTRDGVELPDTASSIAVTIGGTYEVTITRGPCMATSTVVVSLLPAPVIQDPADVIMCNFYELPALALGNYFTGTGGTGTQLPAGTQITTPQTIYIFEQSANGCTAEENFIVNVIPAPQIALSGECRGDNYVVMVAFLNDIYNDENVDFEWRNAVGVLIGGNTSSITVTAQDTYTVIVTPHATDCFESESIIVDDIMCTIQKGISPGDGGLNENFDLSDLNVKNLTIFNRYGQEVYSYANYTNQWSGQDKKGNELPTGTYFYSIERENGDTKTGWIYVNRKN